LDLHPRLALDLDEADRVTLERIAGDQPRTRSRARVDHPEARRPAGDVDGLVGRACSVKVTSLSSLIDDCREPGAVVAYRCGFRSQTVPTSER
jgi:hypothetical protein